MKTNALTTLSKSAKQLSRILSKHSPSIMVVGGVAGSVAATVLACKATLKVDNVLEEKAVKMANTKSEDYSSEDEYKKEIRNLKVKTATTIVKEYAPAAVVGGLSIAMVLGSHGKMKRINAGLSASCAATEGLFQFYRNNVIEEFGEDVDYRMLHGIKEVEVEVEKEVVDEKTGKIKCKKVKEVIPVLPKSSWENPFTRFFSREYSNEAYNDASANKRVLSIICEELNYDFQRDGVLMLDQIWKKLGFPQESISLMDREYGFIQSDMNNPSDLITFRINDVYKPNGDQDDAKIRFINGYEPTVLLDVRYIDGRLPENLHNERVFCGQYRY